MNSLFVADPQVISKDQYIPKTSSAQISQNKFKLANLSNQPDKHVKMVEVKSKGNFQAQPFSITPLVNQASSKNVDKSFQDNKYRFF